MHASSLSPSAAAAVGLLLCCRFSGSSSSSSILSLSFLFAFWLLRLPPLFADLPFAFLMYLNLLCAYHLSLACLLARSLAGTLRLLRSLFVSRFSFWS